VADVRVHRWDELPLEKVTEMVSRKVVTGDRQTMVQVYLKRGAHVPLHRHDSEQMVYVLQGAMRWAVGGRSMTVSEGEVLHVPSGVSHQAEALDDTFQIAVLSDGGRESRGADIASRSGRVP
jgi:quercetin dioxygenase-like cupin family protein